MLSGNCPIELGYFCLLSSLTLQKPGHLSCKDYRNILEFRGQKRYVHHKNTLIHSFYSKEQSNYLNLRFFLVLPRGSN